MQPSNEHCSPSLPFPSPLLLSAFTALLYLFLSLSFHLCTIRTTDPLRESPRQGAATKSQSSTIWKIEQGSEEQKGERRGGKRARKREEDADARTHTRVCRRFRFVPRAWLTRFVAEGYRKLAYVTKSKAR